MIWDFLGWVINNSTLFTISVKSSRNNIYCYRIYTVKNHVILENHFQKQYFSRLMFYCCSNGYSLSFIKALYTVLWFRYEHFHIYFTIKWIQKLSFAILHTFNVGSKPRPNWSMSIVKPRSEKFLNLCLNQYAIRQLPYYIPFNTV